MKLTARDKDSAIYDALLNISNKSFDGIERPPHGIFATHFNEDEVFVDNELGPSGFAFVTQRGGPYIWSIAVISGLRHMGIGSGLLKEVIEYYKGIGSETISLTCKVDNVPAQVLYLKNGFRPVRVRPRYYAAEGDGVLMRRVL